MSKALSPYALCYEALRLIELHDSDEMTTEEEKQIILLLNKSELYPNMSTYQLSLVRKKLAEYYMTHGITGSALEQYQISLTENPRLPVKKIVKSLSRIPACDRIYSVDANITGEPDYIKNIVKNMADNISGYYMPTEEVHEVFSYVIKFTEFSAGDWLAICLGISFQPNHSDSLSDLFQKAINAISNLIRQDGSIVKIEALPSENEHEKRISLTISSNCGQDLKSALFYGKTVEEYRKWMKELLDKSRKDSQQKAAEEDAIYDPEFDEYVEEQLDLLGEDCRKSFYDSVKLRELESEYEPNIWSYKKWAKQTLDCFWDSKRAADRHAEQLSKASGMDFSNMSLSAARAADLTQTEMLFLQYLHHKKTSLDGIAGYWTHEYHMDYEHVIPKFFSLGFLGYADLEYTLKKCTIAEMTALLPKEDTLVKRKKPELIQFLLSRDDLPSLDAYKKLYFEVTPAGKSYLSGQEYPNKDVSFRY